MRIPWGKFNRTGILFHAKHPTGICTSSPFITTNFQEKMSLNRALETRLSSPSSTWDILQSKGLWSASPDHLNTIINSTLVKSHSYSNKHLYIYNVNLYFSLFHALKHATRIYPCQSHSSPILYSIQDWRFWDVPIFFVTIVSKQGTSRGQKSNYVPQIPMLP